jgi:hopanoid biosynthesis associated protein HpnK
LAKHVIFTADDFGLCAEVNEAVERAHRDGVLSAASLMVGAPAAADAVARAKRLPNLRVGIHLTLVEGRPTLPPAEIPALVDQAGMFLNDLVAAGVRWFFLPAARAQLRREIRAQFEAFHATGLTLDHVNAHNHMHLHPTVLSFILEHGTAPVRIPSEPPGGLLAPWLALMRRRLKNAGVRHNDAIVGLRATGHLNAERVAAALANLNDGVTEFYFHPATSATPALEAAAPGYDRTGELAALLSPAIRHQLSGLGLKPLGFRDLA